MQYKSLEATFELTMTCVLIIPLFVYYFERWLCNNKQQRNGIMVAFEKKSLFLRVPELGACYCVHVHKKCVLHLCVCVCLYACLCLHEYTCTCV